MNIGEEKDLIDLIIDLSNQTDQTTYKMLGIDTDAPAGQTLKGGMFNTLVANTLAANTVNVGTVGTSYGSVVEEGTGSFHKTTITLAGAFGAIGGGANLALGRLIYTFPAGVIRVNSVATNSVVLQETESHINADTPELGIGSTIGTGINATLTGTTDDILAGVAVTDCDGTAIIRVDTSTFTMLAAAAHTVHLNIADDWAASGDAALGFTGDVVITWELLS